MKKVISVLVIMAVFSTTLFADPLSVAGSWDTSFQEESCTELSVKTETMIQEFTEGDALFADVSSVALTVEEAQDVKGGLAWWVIAAIATSLIIFTPTPTY